MNLAAAVALAQILQAGTRGTSVVRDPLGNEVFRLTGT
jgi:hypothetical protein